MHHDLSDIGSLILIQVNWKKRTFRCVFWDDRIKINDTRLLGSWRIKETVEVYYGKDLSLSLLHREPGNLGPFFLIGIIAKERIIR